MKKMTKLASLMALVLPALVVTGATVAADEPQEKRERIRVITVQGDEVTVNMDEARRARGDMRGQRMMWTQHLTDSDGEPLSREEIRGRVMIHREAALEKQFENFDLNRDGYITQDEVTEYMVNQAKESAERMFQRLDQAGTGRIDQETFVERFQAMGQERRIEQGSRVIHMRDLSDEDRELIREAREKAREARELAGEKVREIRIERRRAQQENND
ncbi:MAG: EF-hand domain-containing protein [Aliidiomarina sp.]|uniref:EF-hand domain-containing protein n=1 Tax=Aliidiomarina sp. TaxID=1872439 RepID=UPI0025BC9048|nr:EF-hand domain-containing protein [Aliidiomarina sp.]MCH8501590.1 EF-hand domain-containing protein [Aliidiomarina sp.]